MWNDPWLDRFWAFWLSFIEGTSLKFCLVFNPPSSGSSPDFELLSYELDEHTNGNDQCEKPRNIESRISSPKGTTRHIPC